MSDLPTDRDKVRLLRRLAQCGRELGALAGAAELLDAAPALACGACEAEAGAVFAVPRGEPVHQVASAGHEALLPVDALSDAARGAVEAGAGGHLRMVAPGGTSLAVSSAVLAAGSERWVLFAVCHQAAESPLMSAAIDVLAALLEAHLGRAGSAPAPMSKAAESAAPPPASRAADSAAGRPRPPPPPSSKGRYGERVSFEDLLGEAPVFLACIELARRASLSDLPMLLSGERGTGKAMIAQAIHGASLRAGEPFIEVNVAAIPRDHLESELFGQERGAFSGARGGGKPGLFELAGAGTLLLDDIGDVPLDLQVKIVRVLQERVVLRAGVARPIPIRARVVASTHRDLKRAVDEGTFRADLWARLRGMHVRVPPLRERPSDIPLLVDACLASWAARAGRPRPAVDGRVLAALRAYEWPGNVRELMHLVAAEASALAPGETTLRRVPAISRRVSSPPSTPRSDAGGGVSSAPSWRPLAMDPTPPAGTALALEQMERQACKEALERHGGDVTQAARELGVSRRTMVLQMRRYGLDGDAGDGSDKPRS